MPASASASFAHHTAIEPARVPRRSSFFDWWRSGSNAHTPASVFPMWRISHGCTPERPASRFARNSASELPFGAASPTPVITMRASRIERRLAGRSRGLGFEGGGGRLGLALLSSELGGVVDQVRAAEQPARGLADADLECGRDRAREHAL